MSRGAATVAVTVAAVALAACTAGGGEADTPADAASPPPSTTAAEPAGPGGPSRETTAEPPSGAASGDSSPSSPYQVYAPASYDPAAPAPLILLLHGYGSSGEEIEEYLGLETLAEELGFLYVRPDGQVDGAGARFWDATDACCNFSRQPTGDADALADLITSVSADFAVDPDRVHVAGHSNGGFMAYRMACDHADLVASVASIAGATFADADACDPAVPVSVLQVHGEVDDVIRYEGGSFPGVYPGARDTVTTWAGYNGCDRSPSDAAPRDLDDATPGAESPVTSFPGCPTGVSVELWTIPDAGHAPTASAGFPRELVEWLLAHPAG